MLLDNGCEACEDCFCHSTERVVSCRSRPGLCVGGQFLVAVKDRQIVIASRAKKIQTHGRILAAFDSWMT